MRERVVLPSTIPKRSSDVAELPIERSERYRVRYGQVGRENGSRGTSVVRATTPGMGAQFVQRGYLCCERVRGVRVWFGRFQWLRGRIMISSVSHHPNLIIPRFYRYRDARIEFQGVLVWDHLVNDHVILALARHLIIVPPHGLLVLSLSALPSLPGRSRLRFRCCPVPPATLLAFPVVVQSSYEPLPQVDTTPVRKWYPPFRLGIHLQDCASDSARPAHPPGRVLGCEFRFERVE